MFYIFVQLPIIQELKSFRHQSTQTSLVDLTITQKMSRKQIRFKNMFYDTFYQGQYFGGIWHVFFSSAWDPFFKWAQYAPLTA